MWLWWRKKKSDSSISKVVVTSVEVKGPAITFYCIRCLLIMINNYISHFYQRSSHGHAAPHNIRQQAGPGSLRSVLGEPRTLPETYGPGRIQFVPGDRRADVRHPDAALRN